MLNPSTQLSKFGKEHLLNGEYADITHSESVSIMDNQQIRNVLCVFNFQFNLLSISKLTKQLNCIVGFYHECCIFQNLCNGKVLSICREFGGLYLFENVVQPQLSAKVSHPASLYMSIVQDSIPISIWHKRLGHIPLAAMKKMGSLPHRKIDSTSSLCPVCPLGRQSKLPFQLAIVTQLMYLICYMLMYKGLIDYLLVMVKDISSLLQMIFQG